MRDISDICFPLDIVKEDTIVQGKVLCVPGLSHILVFFSSLVVLLKSIILQFRFMFTNKANYCISVIMTFFYSSVLPLGLPSPISVANYPASYANGSFQMRHQLTEALRTEL